MALRLFAALSLPDEIRRRLALLQDDLHGVDGLRWRPPDTFHITLRFYGELPEPVARDLDGELAQITLAPFQIRLLGTGGAGGRTSFSLWAGVEPHPSLSRLSTACHAAARRLNLPHDPRRFTPHVTLAYCKGVKDSEVGGYLSRTGAFRTEFFTVDSFQLYSSWGGSDGRYYTEEAAYPLDGGA